MSGEATLSTGFAGLDRVLQRLWWGDNVVWELYGDASPALLYLAVAHEASEAGLPVAYVAIDGGTPGLRERLPADVIVIEAPAEATGRRRASGPTSLARAVEEVAQRERGRLVVLLDCLEEAHERWGVDGARELFTRLCPTLLRYATIAYWWFSAAQGSSAFREHIRAVTQCALSFGAGRTRVLKAEGRPAWSEGTVLSYEQRDGSVTFHEVPALARLGAALRNLRTERDLSQRDLAALIEVTPSAISQAERGERGLSLETVLRISERLDVSVDALLRGERTVDYRVVRLDPADAERTGEPLTVLEDAASGLRVDWLRLARGQRGVLAGDPGAHRVYGVAAGLCQFRVPGGEPVLRAGEVLTFDGDAPVRCRNLGSSVAVVFGFGAR